MLKGKYVYVGLRGGLGNQLFSLSAGFFAAVTQGKSLAIDATKAQNRVGLTYKESELSAFNLDPIESKLQYLKTDIDFSIFQKSSWKAKQIIARNSSMFQSYQNPGISDISSDILRRTPNIMFKHYEYTDIAYAACKLGFPSPLRLKLESVDFKNIETAIESNLSVALHVRLGDFRNWQLGKYLTDKDFYFSAISDIQNRTLKSKDLQFYLFSDQPIEALEYLPKELPYKIISGKYKLSPAEEVILMSKCNFIISSKSTFAWWACFWHGDDNNVYSPHPGWRYSNWNFVSNKNIN